MKTKGWRDHTGVITVDTTSGGTRTFSYPLSSLGDWYPLCSGYYYKYSEANNKLYLVDEGHTNQDSKYDLGDKPRGKSSRGVCDTENWINPDVIENNKETIDFAKNTLGVHTFDDFYTYKEVIADIKKVCEEITRYTAKKISGGLNPGETVITAETLGDLLKSTCTNTDDMVYSLLGEVLTMLNVMRKSVEE